MREAQLVRSIRFWLGLFILGLFASGITAFPLQIELAGIVRWASHTSIPEHAPGLFAWLVRVCDARTATDARYPFLAYGTDWLAFAHLVIAVAFIGPWRDPVRNAWVVTFGLIACLAILPLALIAGPVRGIPVFWRLIDCSFGVFGSIPLWIVRVRSTTLERLQTASTLPSTGTRRP